MFDKIEQISGLNYSPSPFVNFITKVVKTQRSAKIPINYILTGIAHEV